MRKQEDIHDAVAFAFSWGQIAGQFQQVQLALLLTNGTVWVSESSLRLPAQEPTINQHAWRLKSERLGLTDKKLWRLAGRVENYLPGKSKTKMVV